MANAPSNELRIEMYRKILTAKLFEEKLASLLFSGKVQTFYLPSRGQEPVGVAVGLAMRRDDYLVSYYRGLCEQYAKGASLNRIMAEILGKETGYCKGKGGPMHFADASVGAMLSTGVVGGGIPIANGFGLAAKMKGTDQVTVCMFGDGASNIGSFNEGLNMASLWKLPVVFVCANNLYAEATPQYLHQSIKDISIRAKGYDMAGATADGGDPDAMFEAVTEAIGRARRGGGPTLIEAKTYRLMGHFIGDQMVYMPPEEVAEAKKNDPVPKYAGKLKKEGILSDADLDSIQAKATAEVEEAVQFAMGGPDPSPQEVYDDVYASGYIP